MKRTLNILLGIALFQLIFLSCNDEPKVEETQNQSTEQVKEEIKDVTKVIDNRFPNERSELAILMRSMYEDLVAEKELLSKGENSEVKWMEKYGNLVEATPTDKKHTGPDFEAFGKSFLVTLKAYEKAEKENNIQLYNNVITSCMSCHQKHCPGPMAAIRKLPLY